MTIGTPHYVRPAGAGTAPRHLFVLDTETVTVTHGEDVSERLRLWCAARIDRHPDGGGTAQWLWRSGRTARGLAGSIDTAATECGTVWVYAHNLSFDLATTSLPENLARLGWTVQDFALSAGSPWLKLSRGKLRLVLADSGSLLPASLREVARMLGIARPPLPRQGAVEGRWRARCHADVTVLGMALCELMDWHERQAGGPWSVSGTATGWGHLRHRLPDRTLVVDPRPHVKALDREAIYGGRREAWQVGRWAGHRYLEVDLRDAYPTAATHTLLPCRRRGTFDRANPTDRLFRVPAVSVQAHVRVRTDAPRYPMRTPGGVFYPVGEFWTHLAGPELTDALDHDRVVEIGRGVVHDVSDHLAAWARWTVEQRYARPPDTPAVAALLAKRCGRSVIGKLAGHGWTRERLGVADSPQWRYEPAIDMGSGEQAAIVDLGGSRYLTVRDESSQSAYPAILGWIESRIRVVLGRVIDLLGTGALLAADTDGVVAVERLLGMPGSGGTVQAPPGVTGAARTAWVLGQVNAAIAPFVVQVKRAVLSAEVRGPQHVTMGGQAHIPGMPSYATRDDDDLWRFRAWPGLTWQMQYGDRDAYIRPLIARRVGSPLVAGWVCDDGQVVPARAVVDANGRNRLLGWLNTPDRPPGALLASEQHPVLLGC